MSSPRDNRVEFVVQRYDTLIAVTKQPIVRAGRVIAILTFSTSFTDVATATTGRDLLSLAAHVTDDRLLLYRLETRGRRGHAP